MSAIASLIDGVFGAFRLASPALSRFRDSTMVATSNPSQSMPHRCVKHILRRLVTLDGSKPSVLYSSQCQLLSLVLVSYLTKNDIKCAALRYFRFVDKVTIGARTFKYFPLTHFHLGCTTAWIHDHQAARLFGKPLCPGF